MSSHYIIHSVNLSAPVLSMMTYFLGSAVDEARVEQKDEQTAALHPCRIRYFAKFKLHYVNSNVQNDTCNDDII
jgi:hypothetical protein